MDVEMADNDGDLPMIDTCIQPSFPDELRQSSPENFSSQQEWKAPFYSPVHED